MRGHYGGRAYLFIPVHVDEAGGQLMVGAGDPGDPVYDVSLVMAGLLFLRPAL